MRTLDKLMAAAPHKRWFEDSFGAVFFVDDDTDVSDPFASGCGRFNCDPWVQYGVPHIAALVQWLHNRRVSEDLICTTEYQALCPRHEVPGPSPFEEYGEHLAEEIDALGDRD